MTNEIARYSPGDDGQLVSPGDYQQFVEEFLAGRSPRTMKAYREDLARVADWLGLGASDELAKQLLSKGPGAANRMAIAFKAWATTQRKPPMAPSYVNNHLAAIRSVVKFARITGRIQWALDVADLKAQAFTDTRGPGLDGMVATIRKAREAQPPARAARDVAVISLFAMRGLRRDEIVTLDLEHADLDGTRLFVLRKKQLQREWLTIPPFCVGALRSWLSFRGTIQGPLFKSYGGALPKKGKHGRSRPDGRLAESSVWWLVKNYALKAGVAPKQARPHGFRHGAISELLIENKGNIRAAQIFAGHKNPATTVIYDDNLKDVAGEMSNLLAKKIEEALG